MKKVFPWLLGAAVSGAAWLVYGALVEANKIVLERRRLKLPNWPARLHGYKIGVLADIHLRDCYTVDHAARAIELLLDEEPDMIVLPGDLLGYWKEESLDMLRTVLSPMLLMNDHCIAIPGNHDYWGADPSKMEGALEEVGVKLLRNEIFHKDGICWVGIDSAKEKMCEPIEPMLSAFKQTDPIVVLWHEPDMVELLPVGASLMISGHSHGGQWVFPCGFTPMHTDLGRKYVSGFYPDAPTPLYVSRGLATTGPPSRFGSLPEVSLLILESDSI
jgi:predicted MPP superfamily phosphohydrolase